jgi:hypothetical protein
MLMEDLGFRISGKDEIARMLARRTQGEFEPRPKLLIPAAVLNAEPLISHSGMRWRHSPLGLASIVTGALDGRSPWFLISPTSSIDPAFAETLRELAVLHRFAHPDHRLIFICNEPEEAGLLQERGEAAFFCSQNVHISERIFKPLKGLRLDFDAIYNAQLIPLKRHELSLGIERCGFLFYRDMSLPEAADSEALIRSRHAAAAPGHVFINRLDAEGVPIRCSRRRVNRHLNRASVGLCLSAKEGAMFASTEYLLAGLPIVSTPSVGGRDVYFDEEYCRIAEPDPRSVAEAVQALKAKSIPRTYIRDRTLLRLERDRERFLTLLNAILEASGSAKRLGMPWPFRKTAIMEWLPADEAVRRAADGIVDGFDKEKRNFLRWRRWRQRLFPQH